jgi:hypothetical protein
MERSDGHRRRHEPPHLPGRFIIAESTPPLRSVSLVPKSVPLQVQAIDAAGNVSIDDCCHSASTEHRCSPRKHTDRGVGPSATCGRHDGRHHSHGLPHLRQCVRRRGKQHLTATRRTSFRVTRILQCKPSVSVSTDGPTATIRRRHLGWPLETHFTAVASGSGTYARLTAATDNVGVLATVVSRTARSWPNSTAVLTPRRDPAEVTYLQVRLTRPGMSRRRSERSPYRWRRATWHPATLVATVTGDDAGSLWTAADNVSRWLPHLPDSVAALSRRQRAGHSSPAWQRRRTRPSWLTPPMPRPTGHGHVRPTGTTVGQTETIATDDRRARPVLDGMTDNVGSPEIRSQDARRPRRSRASQK